MKTIIKNVAVFLVVASAVAYAKQVLGPYDAFKTETMTIEADGVTPTGNFEVNAPLDMQTNAITDVGNVDGRDVSADGSQLDTNTTAISLPLSTPANYSATDDQKIKDHLDGIDTALASAGGANTNLSNLTAPTAVNEDLIFEAASPGTVKTADNGAGNSEDLNLEAGTATGTRGDVVISGDEVFVFGKTDFQWDQAGTVDGLNYDFALRTVFQSATEKDFLIMSLGLNSDMYIITDADNNEVPGQVLIRTGNASGTANGADTTIASGQSATGDSGDVILQTGTAGGTRGDIRFLDGSEGTSGHIWTSTGTLGEGNWAAAPAPGDAWGDPVDAHIVPQTTNLHRLGSDTLGFSTGYFAAAATEKFLDFETSAGVDVGFIDYANTVDGITYDLGIRTDFAADNDMLIMALGAGSDVNIITDTADNQLPGVVFIRTGNASGAAQDGSDTTIGTGTATGNAGNVILAPGAGTLSDGDILFQDGSEGTTGHVWTSTDANGSGNWAAAAAGGDLWSDSVDSSIVPDTTYTYDLGSNALGFKRLFLNAAVGEPWIELESDTATDSGMITRNFSIDGTTIGIAMGNDISSVPSVGLFQDNGASIQLITDDTTTSGDIVIRTGNTGNTSGDLTLQTGTATTSRGQINVNGQVVQNVVSFNITADDVTLNSTGSEIATVTATVGDCPAATNCTFNLEQKPAGTRLTILQIGTGAIELIDDAAQGTGGNHRLSATWNGGQDDAITLISDGTDWIEISRSDN